MERTDELPLRQLVRRHSVIDGEPALHCTVLLRTTTPSHPGSECGLMAPILMGPWLETFVTNILHNRPIGNFGCSSWVFEATAQ